MLIILGTLITVIGATALFIDRRNVKRAKALIAEGIDPTPFARTAATYDQTPDGIRSKAYAKHGLPGGIIGPPM